MVRADILAVGRIKKGPSSDLFEYYQKQLKFPLRLHEVESKHKDSVQAKQDENDKLLSLIDPQAHVFALDERGKSIRSLDFAAVFQDLNNTGRHSVQFIIGGADGLGPPIRDRADFLLSFGQQTWPHMLARIMLIEQIYRAQQILNGHPYHRE